MSDGLSTAGKCECDWALIRCLRPTCVAYSFVCMLRPIRSCLCMYFPIGTYFLYLVAGANGFPAHFGFERFLNGVRHDACCLLFWKCSSLGDDYVYVAGVHAWRHHQSRSKYLLSLRDSGELDRINSNNPHPSVAGFVWTNRIVRNDSGENDEGQRVKTKQNNPDMSRCDCVFWIWSSIRPLS